MQKLDTLLAFKGIALSTVLSGTGKRVAGAILDHFNRKNGRCDPGLGRIAGLLGVSRRTVIRAVSRVVKLGLFLKERHGGLSHRNRYEPVWRRFRELDAEWCARLHAKQTRSQGLSPLERQSCHLTGDTDGTQTCSNNHQLPATLLGGGEAKPPNLNALADPKRLAKTGDSVPAEQKPRGHLGRQSYRDAAHNAAERRWNKDLLSRYAREPLAYGLIVDAIDPGLQDAVTRVEQQKAGAGFSYLISELQKRTAGAST